MGVDLGRTHEEPGRGTSLDQPGSLLALGCPASCDRGDKFLFSFSCPSVTFHRGQEPPQEEACVWGGGVLIMELEVLEVS